MIEIPIFATKKETLKWLVDNRDRVLAAKKAVTKMTDDVVFAPWGAPVVKAEMPDDVDAIRVLAVMNTTNLMDSHHDVHIPGLWKKTLQEARNLMHLQEHEMKFSKIIADGDDLKAGTQTMEWKALGLPYKGTTEALIFDSNVKASRNPDMFKEYRAGHVKNHSVGMRYVNFEMAVNDKDWPEEKKIWDKYIDQVANREEAEAVGYFFPVLEAKLIEGSAVPAGSNWATPTLTVEPSKGTPPEPPQGTLFDVGEAIKNTKFLI